MINRPFPESSKNTKHAFPKNIIISDWHVLSKINREAALMNDYAKRIESVIQKRQQNLGDNAQRFISRVYRDGLQKYINRIAAIGFTGQSSMLDAGCGFGQWSLALASKNIRVHACDISKQRVEFVNHLVTDMGLDNLDVSLSSLNSLPFPDASFDAIFCYGVIHALPWRATLEEFKRVLKPGGKLYFTANGLGWYIFLFQEEYNKAKDYDPKKVAANALLDTLNYDREGVYRPGMNIIIEPDCLQVELNSLAFHDIMVSGEGSLHLDKEAEKPEPFFESKYYGMLGVFECMCTLATDEPVPQQLS
jgi:SAM-dependent methyltransferase